MIDTQKFDLTAVIVFFCIIFIANCLNAKVSGYWHISRHMIHISRFVSKLFFSKRQWINIWPLIQQWVLILNTAIIVVCEPTNHSIPNQYKFGMIIYVWLFLIVLQAVDIALFDHSDRFY